ncbi:hypothetical protein IW261DRAFT_375341 [Armillaria novae-zelandiae]|uniref:Uncharacterized protein n=1 Tax=Armillaria novae-zelandiae TaxID=153914 RepID=A0AA39THD9_9AGAR|nr:hypothetical protein IW261DRAFT_375341 [Armillaria novae-zelandiae]
MFAPAAQPLCSIITVHRAIIMQRGAFHELDRSMFFHPLSPFWTYFISFLPPARPRVLPACDRTNLQRRLFPRNKCRQVSIVQPSTALKSPLPKGRPFICFIRIKGAFPLMAAFPRVCPTDGLGYVTIQGLGSYVILTTRTFATSQTESQDSHENLTEQNLFEPCFFSSASTLLFPSPDYRTLPDHLLIVTLPLHPVLPFNVLDISCANVTTNNDLHSSTNSSSPALLR